MLRSALLPLSLFALAAASPAALTVTLDRAVYVSGYTPGQDTTFLVTGTVTGSGGISAFSPIVPLTFGGQTLQPSRIYDVEIGISIDILGTYTGPILAYRVPAQFGIGTLSNVATSQFNGGAQMTNTFSYQLDVEAVPEPASLVVLGLGLAALLRRKARS